MSLTMDRLHPIVFLTGAYDVDQARVIIAVENGLIADPKLRHLTILPTKQQQEERIQSVIKEMDDGQKDQA